MSYRYTYETEFDVDVCYRQIKKPGAIVTDCCPFLNFRDLLCKGDGIVLNCKCALVPWTDGKPTPKFEVPVNKKWERCPLSRKRQVEKKKVKGK